MGLWQEPVRKIGHRLVGEGDGLMASRAAAHLSRAEGPLQSEVAQDYSRHRHLLLWLRVKGRAAGAAAVVRGGERPGCGLDTRVRVWHS